MLSDAFTAICAGGWQVVELMGGPGIGISRVLSEFADSVAADALTLSAPAATDWAGQLLRCHGALTTDEELRADAAGDETNLAAVCPLLGLR